MSNPNTTTATENPLIVAFRQQLLKRSDAGIKSIGLYFRQIDDDGSKMVNFEEFQRGILNHNILMDKNDMVNLFNLFDRNSDGSISFDEFLATVRPPLNNFRLNIIYKAFQKLDKTNDHKITVEDLKGVYNVKHHPKYQNGEWDENQCLTEFLNHFEVDQHKDGIVTYDEFVQYYSGVSASIDSDVYFDVMMRNAWKL